MTNRATLEKMEKLKLFGMLRAFNATAGSGVRNDFTPDEFLAHLIDAEWDDRRNRRLERLVKRAKFRYQASIEQVDFTHKRNLDKNMFLRFADCIWLEEKQNIIITGATGLGKSFLPSALGHQACLYGYKTLSFNCTKLFPLLGMYKADGSFQRELSIIAKQDLIILDDFGLVQLDKDSRLALLEIIEDRIGRESTIITSQFPVSKWHEIIGDDTIADAICDRLVHSAHRIELEGKESLRKYYKKA